MPYISLEAECTRCHAFFIPLGTEPVDLVHDHDEVLDQDCGGLGIIQGLWHLTTEQGADIDFSHLQKLEEHARAMPNCDDPDCEFHHPEVIEMPKVENPSRLKSYEFPYGQGNQGPGTGPEGERLI